MAKGGNSSGGKGGNSNGGKGGNSNGGRGSSSHPGPGGNWPSTNSNPSGGGRGNAPSKQQVIRRARNSPPFRYAQNTIEYVYFTRQSYT